MCGGVLYTYEGKDYRVYFPSPKAVLPIKLKDGGVSLLPWGRRKEQAGKLPMGGWARLDSINAGKWDRYFPVPTKIMVDQFMEKDIEGKSHWFLVTSGQWIQGLVARERDEQRVYVVTIAPEFDDAVHDRWPRILAG